MAVVVWTGNAQSTAQVTLVTVSGSVAGSEAIKITVNGKDYTYTTSGGQTTAQIATALYDMLAAVDEPEFRLEIVFSNGTASVVTCTAAAAGVPFTISRTVTGGTVVVTITTPTASAGPNDASTLDNYSTGALPIDATDSLLKPAGTPDILYGLTALSSLTLIDLTVLGGRVGLPTQNPAGYTEYRTTSLTLGGCGTIHVGDGVDAPEYCRVKVNGSATCTVTIDSGASIGADVRNPTTLLTTGGSEALVISVNTGSLGLALESGEAAAVTSIKVGTNGPPGSVGGSDESAAASWGTGATVTACTLYAGEIRASASTALTIESGTYTRVTGAIGAITSTSGGTIILNGSGNIGAVSLTGPDAVLDMSGDSIAVGSITSLTAKGGSFAIDPHKRLGNLAFVLDRLSASRCDFGSTFTLTRS